MNYVYLLALVLIMLFKSQYMFFDAYSQIPQGLSDPLAGYQCPADGIITLRRSRYSGHNAVATVKADAK